MSTIPSPATVKPIRFTDKDVGYSYVEFPDDTIFLESMATHSKFRPEVAFVPVQRVVDGVEESHLYEINPSMTEAKHIAGPLASPDGSTDVTVFGSALTAKGILYLCAFNRNSILALDLTKLPKTPQKTVCSLEIPGLSSPNDVCVDPSDEKTLYVAGGTFRMLCCCCCCCPFSNSAHGKVYKVNLQNGNNHPIISIQADDLKTLAGIEVIGSKIWIAQLFDLLYQEKTTTSKSTTTVAWRGNDADGNVWLADNVDIMGDWLLCPAYSTVPVSTVERVMKRSFILSTALFFLQMATAWTRRERFRAAIRDPEVSLSFSNTYLKEEGEEQTPPAPIRLILMHPESDNKKKTVHFEIDLSDTRAKHAPWTVRDPVSGKVLGKRHFFNEQVTHAGHMRDADGMGHIVCVNFEEPRILFLKDQVFHEAMSGAS